MIKAAMIKIYEEIQKRIEISHVLQNTMIGFLMYTNLNWKK
jgi:hypothetical protein